MIVLRVSGSHCMYVKYGSTARIRSTLDVIRRRCVRKILGLTWQDWITNIEELMRRAGMIDLWEILKTRRLRLTGHVLRLSEDRPASV